MEYRGLSLSEFQIQAIDAIKSNKHVLVSTHTGNGKTLVADYAVEMCINEGHQVIYTAPIKALSNQKFLQFKKNFGETNVGLITGDRVINDLAPVRVMTTEILCNMLHEDPRKVDNVKYIIFDEIHYLNDEERGTVWEESIIFIPKDTRLIGLSATIPNFDEICSWIEYIHGTKVERVFYPNRIVPQQYFYYDRRFGACKKSDLVKYTKEDLLKDITNHTHLVSHLKEKDLLPALFFVFSRKQCEAKALELCVQHDFLDSNEKEQITEILNKRESDYPILKGTKSWRSIRSSIENGICFHHAGLLPIIKEIVEDLFEKKLIKVLYATETFAVGINYPVRTVCFDSHRKYDGKSFRNLTGSEYLQMAGRAGRRGIDEFGYVFSLLDYGDRNLDPSSIPDLDKMQSDPIKSQFRLSYTTTANLYSSYSREQISQIFQKSFATFQFRNNLEERMKFYESAKSQFEAEENKSKNLCMNFNTGKCPALHDENSFRLRQLIRLVRSNLPQAEKDIVRRQAEKLKYWFRTNPNPNCPKSHSKKKDKHRIARCIDSIMVLNTMESNLKELERNAFRDPEKVFNKDYDKKIGLLKNLHYIEEPNLTNRGEFCSKIHVQELLITELVFDGVFHDTDEDTLNAYMAGIVFEDNKMKESFFKHKFDYSRIYNAIDTLCKSEALSNLETSITFIDTPCASVFEWSRGCELHHITANHPEFSEGDFVALCRRIIDLYRQIKNSAIEDTILSAKINRCIDKLNRDVVELGL